MGKNMVAFYKLISMLSGNRFALFKSLSCLVETHIVCPTPVIRIVTLNVVIFPAAYVANVKMPGLIIRPCSVLRPLIRHHAR